jgi:DNA-binding response OmpR family regulator
MTTAQTQKKILIVEDELMLLDVLHDEFSAAGFKVFKAKDGTEGLAVATKENPDIILVDILMPKMDGITMLKEIHSDPTMQKTPAIILTNLSDNKTIEQALENGAYDFLVKTDWNPKDLVKHVKEKLNIA